MLRIYDSPQIDSEKLYLKRYSIRHSIISNPKCPTVHERGFIYMMGSRLPRNRDLPARKSMLLTPCQRIERQCGLIGQFYYCWDAGCCIVKHDCYSCSKRYVFLIISYLYTVLLLLLLQESSRQLSASHKAMISNT